MERQSAHFQKSAKVSAVYLYNCPQLYLGKEIATEKRAEQVKNPGCLRRSRRRRRRG